MIIDLYETYITEQIVRTIVDAVLETEKLFRKIAFVGVEKHWQKQLVAKKHKVSLSDLSAITKKQKNG